MSNRIFVGRRRALSRVLVEILLIVISVAATSMAYYAWSSTFAPSSKVVSAAVLKVEGSVAANAVWVTVKNTGNVALTTATLDNPTITSPNTVTCTWSYPATTLNPGDSMVIKIYPSSGSFIAGTYYFHLTLSGAGGTAIGVEAKITLS